MYIVKCIPLKGFIMDDVKNEELYINVLSYFRVLTGNAV